MRLLGFFFVCWLGFTANFSLRAETNCQALSFTKIDLSDAEYLIVNVRINGRTQVDGSDAYFINQRLLLPVSRFAEILSTKLSYSKTQLTWQDNQQQCHWPITKSPSAVALLVAVDEYDSYVDSKLLDAILATETQFSYELLQLSASTELSTLLTQSTPQAQDNQTINSNVSLAITPDKVVEDQYHWLTAPIVNYQINHNVSDAKSNQVTTQLNSTFDLLGQQTQWRYNRTQNGAQQYLKFNYQTESLQQPIKIQWGDIQTDADNLIHQSKAGLGLKLSNDGEQFNSSFSTITIEEPALAGWRAELYRNGQYLEQTEAGDDNRVLFENINTFFGSNVFEIKLFGPEGQQETHIQRFQVGKQSVPANQWRYQLSLADNNQSLLNNTSSSGLAFNRSAHLAVNYGLTENNTINVNADYLANSINKYQQPNWYWSTSVNGFVANGQYHLQLTKQHNAGNAVGFEYKGDVLEKTAVNMSYFRLNNFESERFTALSPIEQQLNISLNGQLSWFKQTNWQTRIQWQQGDRLERQQVSLNLSKSLTQGVLSSDLAYDNLSGREGLLNRLYYSGNWQQWQISSSLNWYPLRKDQRLSQWRTSLRWPQSQQVFQQTQLNYNANDANAWQLNHQLTWRHPNFNFRLGANVNNAGHWQVSAGISGTLSYDTANNDVWMLPPQSLNAGLIEAQVFVDQNNNQIFDNQDIPLENVGFTGNYLWRDKFTNNQGKVLLPSANGQQILAIKEQTLSDPFLAVKYNKVQTYSHKGGITQVQLPLLTVNDIEGSLYFAKNDQTKPAANQTISLVTLAGETIASTTSEYDGYFLFSQIPPGQYSLSIDSEQIQQQQLVAVNLPQTVTASQPGDAIVLSDILLMDQASWQAKNKVQNQTNSTAQSTHHVEQLPQLQGKWVIQLGVYHKLISIFDAVQALPDNILDIAIYYHQKRKKYYLVTGPYLNTKQASANIEKLIKINQYQGVFLQLADKYQQSQWQLKYQLRHLADKLNEAKQIVAAAKPNSYFCQLASYRAINSINSTKLSRHHLLMLKRKVRNRHVYTLLAGPFNSKQHCAQDSLAGITPEQPEFRLAWRLQQEMID